MTIQWKHKTGLKVYAVIIALFLGIGIISFLISFLVNDESLSSALGIIAATAILGILIGGITYIIIVIKTWQNSIKQNRPSYEKTQTIKKSENVNESYLLKNASRRASIVVYTIFIIPVYGIPGAICGMLWSWVFGYNFGLGAIWGVVFGCGLVLATCIPTIIKTKNGQDYSQADRMTEWLWLMAMILIFVFVTGVVTGLIRWLSGC